MATKREELKAFKKLKKNFPNSSFALAYNLCSWKEEGVYHVTINDIGSNCGENFLDPMDAVDNAIERFKVIP